MPIPTNTSALTATDLGMLPASVFQDVHDAGNTYTVWYKITAHIGQNEIGVFGFGDLSIYRPTVAVFIGPPESPVSHLLIAAQNTPVQFPVEAGTTYFLRFTTNSGNPTPAILIIEAEAGPTDTAPAGSLFIPDDTVGFPGVVISAVDGEVLQFVYPFPAGETGDVLAGGRILVEDLEAGDLKLYSPTIDLLATVPFTWVSGHPQIRTNFGLNRWIVGDRGAGATDARLTHVDVNGNLSGVIFTLPVAGLTALGENLAGTVAYFSGQGSSLNSQIARWDLVLDAAMSDLVADFGGTYTVFDMLVLSDDSLIVGYKQNSPVSIIIKHYSAAGATLHTYDLGSGFLTQGPHLAYAIDHPDSFWAWTHLTGANTGVSQFQNIQVSDGAVLTAVLSSEYEGGAYQPAETAAPLDRFGNSFSCPFFLLREALVGDGAVGIIGPLVWWHFRRRQP